MPSHWFCKVDNCILSWQRIIRSDFCIFTRQVRVELKHATFTNHFNIVLSFLRVIYPIKPLLSEAVIAHCKAKKQLIAGFKVCTKMVDNVFEELREISRFPSFISRRAFMQTFCIGNTVLCKSWLSSFWTPSNNFHWKFRQNHSPHSISSLSSEQFLFWSHRFLIGMHIPSQQVNSSAEHLAAKKFVLTDKWNIL